MTNLKQLLSADDRDILNASADISWIPKDPKKVLLPYVTNTTAIEESELDQKKAKVKEVLDGYDDIIKECKILESKIKGRCKAVSAPISKQYNLRVLEAMRRVFGPGDYESITFEHYEACIRALAIASNQVPRPEDK